MLKVCGENKNSIGDWEIIWVLIMGEERKLLVFSYAIWLFHQSLEMIIPYRISKLSKPSCILRPLVWVVTCFLRVQRGTFFLGCWLEIEGRICIIKIFA